MSVSESAELVTEHDEPHEQGVGARRHGRRAGVLGAGAGSVSPAGLVIGGAAATTDRGAILTAGLAGVAAGAMSMAVGEYVSVSTQRDAEMALLAKERRELRDEPEAELLELAGLYEAKGLTAELAHDVAVQLTAHDALAAHAETELGIDPEALTKPWHAAWASFIAFTVGALIPLVAILVVSPGARVPVTVVAVVLALLFTGWTSARLSSAAVGRAVWRNIAGGLLAMAVTYLIGLLVGTQL